jgi:hypothetical protein
MDRLKVNPGSNTITVEVTDEAGNTSSAAIAVTCDPAADTEAPGLSGFNIQDGDLLLGSDDLVVIGTVDDYFSDVKITVNDSDPIPCNLVKDLDGDIQVVATIPTALFSR